MNGPSHDTRHEARKRVLYFGCYIVSACALAAACAHMIFGTDRVLGIFLVIVAVILARVLILNIAERLFDHRASAGRRADQGGDAP